MVFLLTGCPGIIGAADLQQKIHAAQSDIRIICPVEDIDNIPWTALLYLNHIHGADITIARVHPAPVFGYSIADSEDNQFHLLEIGRGTDMDDSSFVDSLIEVVFDGIYPDIAIIASKSSSDSAQLVGFARLLQVASRNDTLALAHLRQIFIAGPADQGAGVILNDAELYHEYRKRLTAVSKELFGVEKTTYSPQRFRWYYPVEALPQGTPPIDFIPDFDTFRLPDIISARLFDGPEQKNLLARLARYRSYLRAAYKLRSGRSEQLQLIGSAYREFNEIMGIIRRGLGGIEMSRIEAWAQRIHHKAYLAVAEAIGVRWLGNIERRKTPFGSSAKLTLDIEVFGPRPVELSYFRLNRDNQPPIVVDSISKIIEPHQRFYREYAIDLGQLDVREATGDSLLFSIEAVVEGLALELFVPYREFSDEMLNLEFLPGYAILAPFTDDPKTALAQPFDWQIKITKPYGSELDGTLTIHTPDGIVVGSYNKSVFMPQGTTRKYRNIYLAAGRSMGYDLKTVRATLEVGGQEVATASADVRIVRCEVPDTRDIAFIPDDAGKLEDFLRMARVSFEPLTRRGMARAALDAFDVIVFGPEATEYYDVLRSSGDRIHEFVENGGDVIIFGQAFGWPSTALPFHMYVSRQVTDQPAANDGKDHALLREPYDIKLHPLLSRMDAYGGGWPAIMGGGAEILRAGELGSYLRVAQIGEGHIIYCGLPLLDMAADLNIEAVHFLANLLNFGHGQ